ncbi:MAG: relaxase/mobilization nuclease domain-containing protein [Lachnospiraceae bacterium]|nr:relaxase/mobilization nuclease domain-containing protein [Lachnospiraceae bacterium]
MAATWIQPIHATSSKSVLRTYEDSINYILNPDKTEGGRYVYGYNVAPEAAVNAFAASRSIYGDKTGRKAGNLGLNGDDREVLMYHMRQSFAPGEVTPEQAIEISKQLAMEFSHGEHSFIIACHTDQEHIHCHIMFNSIKESCLGKFNNYKNSAWAVRHISDRLCLENGLSIIDPEWNGMNYSEWLAQDNPALRHISQRNIIASDVKKLLASDKIKTYDDFMEKMLDAGYDVKDGKVPAFRLPGKDRFIRLDTLKKYGCGYDKETLIKVISGEVTPPPPDELSIPKGLDQSSKTKKPATVIQDKNNISLLIDIQEKIRQGKGRGYEQWAKIFNVKQGAESINYMIEHGINNYTELAAATEKLKNQTNYLRTSIKDIEAKLAEIAAMKKQVINLAKTSDVYKEYRRLSGRAKNVFYYENQADLTIHEAARQYFKNLEMKAPTIAALNSEYKEQLSAKNRLYAEYKTAKKEYQTILTVKKNVDMLTERDEQQLQPEHIDRKDEPAL